MSAETPEGRRVSEQGWATYSPTLSASSAEAPGTVPVGNRFIGGAARTK